MKRLTNILSIVALALAFYNATMINFDTPFEGDSFTAIITILAALCSILLLQILRISINIQDKLKQK